MPTLRDMQTDFAAALLDGVVEPAALRITPRHGDRLAGIHVHRNNVREGFTKTLALEFPVLERLVGNDYFRQLAHEYLREFPSRSGDLHYIGAPFASFLAKKFADTAFEYLADIARLEWLCEVLSIAAQDEFAELKDFGNVDPEFYPQLQLELRSDRALLASAFPVMKIWRSNQPGAAAEHVDLAQGGDWLLVLRGSSGIELLSLQCAEYHFVQSLGVGATLSQALERAQAADLTFDVNAALQRFFRHQVFRRIVVPKSSLSQSPECIA